MLSTGKGFTLVELLVVLVILSLVATLVVPRLAATLTCTARGEAGAIAAELALLSEQAQASGIASRLRLSLVRPYERQATRQVGALGQSEGARVALGSCIESLSVATAADNGGESAWLTLYPDGSAEPAELTLRCDSGEVVRLRLRPLLSQVDLEDIHGSR